MKANLANQGHITISNVTINKKVCSFLRDWHARIQNIFVSGLGALGGGGIGRGAEDPTQSDNIQFFSQLILQGGGGEGEESNCFSSGSVPVFLGKPHYTSNVRGPKVVTLTHLGDCPG